MALSRREFQLALDRISKLESKVRMLEDKMKVFEGRLTGESLMRILKETEEQDRLKKEREKLLEG